MNAAARPIATDSRKQVVIIAGLDTVHFTSGKLKLDESGKDHWIPVEDGELFRTVEQALQDAGEAHHAVDMTFLRRCGGTTDYAVRYAPAI